MKKSQHDGNTQTIEPLLAPIRQQITAAQTSHSQWKELQAKIADCRARIDALEVSEHELVDDLEIEPGFAAKKIFEARGIAEVLRMRIPLLENFAKAPLIEFQNSVRWLLVDYRWNKPIDELVRRHQKRVRQHAAVELGIDLNHDQILKKVEPVPNSCQPCVNGRLLGEEHLNNSALFANYLTMLEQAWPHVEELIKNESEILADQSLDEVPDEQEPSSPPVYSTNRLPDPLMGVRYVARRQLGFEGGNYPAGCSVDSIPKSDLQRLIQAGVVVTVAEFRKLKADEPLKERPHFKWQDGRAVTPRDIFVPIEEMARR